MNMLRFVAATGLLLLLAANASAVERLRMSTTTSTENSGLLKVLLPPFEQKYACKIDVVAVGTGKSLKIGEAGDADIVFVHARKLEDKFVADGFGVNRRDVMYNDFIIIGPADDPAGVHGAKKAAEALARIAGAQAAFNRLMSYVTDSRADPVTGGGRFSQTLRDKTAIRLPGWLSVFRYLK